jgi:large subunit ribosomal protein L4
MSTQFKKYDINGNELETASIAHAENWQVHPQVVKDYIVALRTNARQWSASTRDKSESSHSYKKPHAQKGTGKARQGSLSAPQYKGGGRVHTPRPKFDQHVRINQKERRQAIKAILIQKLIAGDVVCLKDDISNVFEKPKTGKVSKFLNALGFNKTTLFLGDTENLGSQKSFRLSMRNIPATSYVYLENMNGYTLLAHKKIIVLEESMAALEKLLRGESE